MKINNDIDREDLIKFLDYLEDEGLIIVLRGAWKSKCLEDVIDEWENLEEK